MSYQPKGATRLGQAVAMWLCYALALSLLLATFPQTLTETTILLYKITVPGAIILALVAVPVFLAQDAIRFKRK